MKPVGILGKTERAQLWLNISKEKCSSATLILKCYVAQK